MIKISGPFTGLNWASTLRSPTLSILKHMTVASAYLSPQADRVEGLRHQSSNLGRSVK
ncbi:hypothetical protein IE4771_PB00286 (plasmid) [Rhizobium etli bv. mimosae str. IE4771]|uniref:Uncharacterized protein n=1 Tax=Rhizobium etli bv. mimosae str. IE4771 TaxID=1432050 RepID=A0A060I8H8_RHIET|nr:hypothetical protein IE4771_PB00286 [Rhizobium sp. IE4771]